MNDLFRPIQERRVFEPQRAHSIIRQVINQDPETRDYDLLADSYAHFKPTVTHDLKKLAANRFLWVASATAERNDDRYYLCYIQSMSRLIMASNGIRIHMAMDDREPGFYWPDNGEYFCDLSDMNFPDLAGRFIKPSQKYRIRDIRLSISDESDPKNLWVQVEVPGASHFPVLSVSANELNQALVGFQYDAWVDALSGSPELGSYQPGALYLTSHKKAAIVMGIGPEDRLGSMTW